MRKEYDFSRAKRAVDVPHLVKLQAEMGGKTRITMRVDNSVLAAFKARAELNGGSYQTMMNEALKQFALGQTLVDVVRETIRVELQIVKFYKASQGIAAQPAYQGVHACATVQYVVAVVAGDDVAQRIACAVNIVRAHEGVGEDFRPASGRG
jgi:uncharacterized protein (DUF4415 family)